MHILETYALSCGLKIDRPHVYEHYTSVPFEKFISFNKINYPYYMEVIGLIKPELDKRNIGILQVRTAQQDIEADVSIYDNLPFGQWAYIMKHSMLHFGEDNFLFDLAGHFDVPRVILFSNTYPNTSKPYWGSKDKERILFSTGNYAKPSLSSDPNLSFVKTIKPEVIAQSIMDLLGIEWTSPYETVFAGNLYRPQHDIIEVIPSANNHAQVNGRISTLGIRMDYSFDEDFLARVLSQHKASIVTSKPINMALLENFRNNIAEIAYIVDENSDVAFAKNLSRLNLPSAVLSYNPDILIKEKFFEITVVNQLPSPKISDFPELKNGLNGLYYKSSKRVFSESKEYKGRYDYEIGRQSLPLELSPCPEEENNVFMRELDFFYLVRLK